MRDGCTVCVRLSYKMKFGGFLMKSDQTGRLCFQTSMYFDRAKNALLPIGEKWMDEMQEKVECRS